MGHDGFVAESVEKVRMVRLVETLEGLARIARIDCYSGPAVTERHPRGVRASTGEAESGSAARSGIRHIEPWGAGSAGAAIFDVVPQCRTALDRRSIDVVEYDTC